MRLIPYWRHLASKLGVEVDVIRRLEQYTDFSPTIRLFESLEASQPDLTIKQLKDALLEIGRNDLFSLLTTKGITICLHVFAFANKTIWQKIPKWCNESRV